MLEEIHELLKRRSDLIQRLIKAFNGVPYSMQLARLTSFIEIERFEEIVELQEQSSYKDIESLVFNFGSMGLEYHPGADGLAEYYMFGDPRDPEKKCHFIPNANGWEPLYLLLDTIYKDLKGIEQRDRISSLKPPVTDPES